MKLYEHDLQQILDGLKKLKEAKLQVDSFRIGLHIIFVERTTDQRDGDDYYITEIKNHVI